MFVPLRALIVRFWNRHQYNVGGGWKDDQIIKYRFSFTVIKKENSSHIFLITYEEAMLLEFSSFISENYVICF